VNSGLPYTYRISTNLQDWETEPATVTFENPGVADEDGVQTVSVFIELPEESDKLFLRVKAEQAANRGICRGSKKHDCGYFSSPPRRPQAMMAMEMAELRGIMMAATSGSILCASATLTAAML